jgi:hypothetical protein
VLAIRSWFLLRRFRGSAVKQLSFPLGLSSMSPPILVNKCNGDTNYPLCLFPVIRKISVDIVYRSAGRLTLPFVLYPLPADFPSRCGLDGSENTTFIN